MLGAKHILNVVPSTPIDRRESAASTTPDGDSKATKDADTQEFDEYGAELKPEARVWKTYIHEAEKFDLEQFDGWNRFLIESSKSLKENPAETSARRLDQIVILLVGANTGGTSISPLNTTEIIAPQPFSPRPIDICINTLWSFSLITSAAVPPIAMLAKEWCYLFTDLGLDNQGSPPQLQGLEKNIRDARDEINKQIIAYTSSNRHFLPKHNSIQALSIGSTAASRCLRSLGNGVQTQTQELYNTAVDLLEHCKSREARLNPQEIQFLMTGITMLLSSLLVDCSPAASARYVMKLLEIAYTTTGDQEQLPLSYLGLPMVVYALSQHNYPGLTQPPPHSSRSRAQRAIEVIAYYVSHPSELANVSSAMVNLGILELLSDPESYKLNSEDFKTICEAFDPGPREARIHTLPAISNTDIYSRSLKGIIKLISDEQHNMLDENTREVAIVCLTVLNHTRVVQWAAGSSFEQVYTFLIECVLKIPPSGPESYGQNTALDLMQKFHKHVQSQLTGIPSLGLAKSLDKRKIFAKLKEAVEIHTTSNDADFTTHLFAIGQASFLIDFAIKSQLADHEDWIRCLGSFVGNESLSESGELTRRGNNLAEWYREVWRNDSTRRHTYFNVLESLLPSAVADYNPFSTAARWSQSSLGGFIYTTYMPQLEHRESAQETPAIEVPQPSTQPGMTQRHELSEIDLSATVTSEGNQSDEAYIRYLTYWV
ncbi:hypothetical protein RSOL_313580, partial [Rhizoctonia solani AG-3 Rhs1AP]